MEENFLSPWENDRENEPHSSYNKHARFSHSFVKDESVHAETKQSKINSHQSITRKSHK